ncbi:hypothetical protein [Kingella sp. (in: b-proteobacteria)]|uniref:hypothetical protein n=1 Tax=Kingella sp. (in: b-proteobacteria) TaxID=2020713 RepID=UPI0026DB62FE|nr:hypothetical protein [Kingella sp. (in: b-proteobacteria)]MDO4657693.1 hypothetical protein [Kingella sp. (in: b-proteobacteria)]
MERRRLADIVPNNKVLLFSTILDFRLLHSFRPSSKQPMPTTIRQPENIIPHFSGCPIIQNHAPIPRL